MLSFTQTVKQSDSSGGNIEQFRENRQNLLPLALTTNKAIGGQRLHALSTTSADLSKIIHNQNWMLFGKTNFESQQYEGSPYLCCWLRKFVQCSGSEEFPLESILWTDFFLDSRFWCWDSIDRWCSSRSQNSWMKTNSWNFCRHLVARNPDSCLPWDIFEIDNICRSFCQLKLKILEASLIFFLHTFGDFAVPLESTGVFVTAFLHGPSKETLASKAG